MQWQYRTVISAIIGIMVLKSSIVYATDDVCYTPQGISHEILDELKYDKNVKLRAYAAGSEMLQIKKALKDALIIRNKLLDHGVDLAHITIEVHVAGKGHNQETLMCLQME